MSVISSIMVKGLRFFWSPALLPVITLAAMAVIVLSVSLAVDPHAYRGYHVPKYSVYVIAIAVFFPMMITWAALNRVPLVFSLIEVLLVCRILWLVITEPGLAGLEFSFLLLSGALLVCLMVRNGCYAYSGGSTDSLVDPRLMTGFLVIVLVAAVVQALLGVMQAWQMSGFEHPLIKTVAVGTIGPPNGFGGFIAIGVASGTALWFCTRNRLYRALLLAMHLLLLSALWVNASRGAVLGLAGAGVLVAVLRLLRNYPGLLAKPRQIIAGVALALLLFGTVTLVLYHQNPASSEGRMVIWQISAHMAADHPVTGVGHGRFGYYYLDHQGAWLQQYPLLVHKAAPLHQPHNEYLNAFVEGGIPGGLLYLGIWIVALGGVIRVLLDKHRKAPAALWGVLAVLSVVAVHSLVDDPMHVLPIAAVAWMAMGLVPGLPIVRLKTGVWSLFAVPFAIIVSVVVIHSVGDRYQGYRQWQQGQEAAKVLDWRTAVHHYEQGLEKLTGQGELLFHYGAARTHNGQPRRGIEAMDQASMKIRDRNLSLSLAWSWLRQGDPEQALYHAHKAAFWFPDHLAPHLLLGEIYYELGEYEKSKYALLRCIHRQTTIQSNEVRRISREARQKWETWYE